MRYAVDRDSFAHEIREDDVYKLLFSISFHEQYKCENVFISSLSPANPAPNFAAYLEGELFCCWCYIFKREKYLKPVFEVPCVIYMFLSRKQYNSKFKRVYRYKSASMHCCHNIFAGKFCIFLRFHRKKMLRQPRNLTPSKHKRQWRFSFWHIACVAFRPGTNFTRMINSS